jgi:hypothetical protein
MRLPLWPLFRRIRVCQRGPTVSFWQNVGDLPKATGSHVQSIGWKNGRWLRLRLMNPSSTRLQTLLTAALLTASAGPVEAASARNFFSPVYDGQPVAFCLEASGKCGRAAANIWCRSKGFDKALSYARRPLPAGLELRFVDTGNLCSTTECIGFSQIKCMTRSD